MNRRSSIHIRSLPSVGATERAIGKAYSREDIVTLRSLKYAYAVLSVIVMETGWGGIPPGWADGGSTFRRGFVLYNAQTALERLRARLEPLDFDVEYYLSRPLADTGLNSKRG